jgi:hypothetical protein
MERIEDHEIAPLWAEHYPKYKSDIRENFLVLAYLCAL